MTKLILVRQFMKPNLPTPGTLWLDLLVKEPLCFTFELPWLNNQAGKSCIPVGTYDVTPEKHPAKGKVFRLAKVSGRAGILIHVGNYAADTNGCILVGKKLSLDQGFVLYNSKSAMDELFTKFTSAFKLEVVCAG